MAAMYRFDNHTDFTDLRDRDGEVGTIDLLPESDFDREDIGQSMYLFTPETGKPFHVFEDELTLLD